MTDKIIEEYRNINKEINKEIRNFKRKGTLKLKILKIF